jgi:hypothetical protein
MNQKLSTGKEYVDVDFSFAPNGSSAVAASSIRGENIASVTRTGVGVFDIVLRNGFYQAIAFKPSVQLGTDADTQISSWNWVQSTKTLTIRVRTAAVAADIAANASNRLGGTLTLRKSSVGK